MRDFTSKAYIKLIEAIQGAGYSFQTIEEFLIAPKPKVVVFRHDSDIWPLHDLRLAQIENQYGIKSTYYFRVPHTYKVKIISAIKELGHEIGYHYENLADTKGNFEKAIVSFKENLEKLREVYPIKTIAMHGRPLSPWDSRKLWEKYSFKEYGLIGEPYLSIDYNSVFYLTDNGSRWDGKNTSIRDTVSTKYSHSIRTTFDLANAFKNGDLPDQIIINAHAARWNDNLGLWIYRFFLQKAKNVAKYFLKRIFHREAKAEK